MIVGGARADISAWIYSQRYVTMRASVIIVSYNSRAYLEPCIESLRDQLGPHDELIVVDNGSCDGSADLVCERFPWARLDRGPNRGYAGGNNRGAAMASGDYLVFLNPDTWLAPHALDALLAPLIQPGAVALSTACLVHMDRPEIINTCGNTMHLTGLTYCRGAGRLAKHYATPCDVDAISGAACAIRSAVFAELGGFDERFFMYVEDTDLSLRARLAGYRVRYVPSAVVAHDYQMRYTPTKAFYLDRNRHLMLRKNLSRTTYRRLLPALLLGELITWGFLLLKGPRYWDVKLRVYAWLWRFRPIPSGVPDPIAEGTLLASMAIDLDLGQMVNPMVASTAGTLLRPPFRAAQEHARKRRL